MKILGAIARKSRELLTFGKQFDLSKAINIVKKNNIAYAAFYKDRGDGYSDVEYIIKPLYGTQEYSSNMDVKIPNTLIEGDKPVIIPIESEGKDGIALIFPEEQSGKNKYSVLSLNTHQVNIDVDSIKVTPSNQTTLSNNADSSHSSNKYHNYKNPKAVELSNGDVMIVASDINSEGQYVTTWLLKKGEDLKFEANEGSQRMTNRLLFKTSSDIESDFALLPTKGGMQIIYSDSTSLFPLGITESMIDDIRDEKYINDRDEKCIFAINGAERCEQFDHKISSFLTNENENEISHLSTVNTKNGIIVTFFENGQQLYLAKLTGEKGEKSEKQIISTFTEPIKSLQLNVDEDNVIISAIGEESIMQNVIDLGNLGKVATKNFPIDSIGNIGDFINIIYNQLSGLTTAFPFTILPTISTEINTEATTVPENTTLIPTSTDGTTARPTKTTTKSTQVTPEPTTLTTTQLSTTTAKTTIESTTITTKPTTITTTQLTTTQPSITTETTITSTQAITKPTTITTTQSTTTQPSTTTETTAKSTQATTEPTTATTIQPSTTTENIESTTGLSTTLLSPATTIPTRRTTPSIEATTVQENTTYIPTSAEGTTAQPTETTTKSTQATTEPTTVITVQPSITTASTQPTTLQRRTTTTKTIPESTFYTTRDMDAITTEPSKTESTVLGLSIFTSTIGAGIINTLAPTTQRITSMDATTDDGLITTESNSEERSLSTGEIGGIVAMGAVAVVTGFMLCACYCRYRSSRRLLPSEYMDDIAGGGLWQRFTSCFGRWSGQRTSNMILEELGNQIQLGISSHDNDEINNDNGSKSNSREDLLSGNQGSNGISNPGSISSGDSETGQKDGDNNSRESMKWDSDDLGANNADVSSRSSANGASINSSSDGQDLKRSSSSSNVNLGGQRVITQQNVGYFTYNHEDNPNKSDNNLEMTNVVVMQSNGQIAINDSRV